MQLKTEMLELNWFLFAKSRLNYFLVFRSRWLASNCDTPYSSGLHVLTAQILVFGKSIVLRDLFKTDIISL